MSLTSCTCSHASFEPSLDQSKQATKIRKVVTGHELRPVRGKK